MHRSASRLSRFFPFVLFFLLPACGLADRGQAAAGLEDSVSTEAAAVGADPTAAPGPDTTRAVRTDTTTATGADTTTAVGAATTNAPTRPVVIPDSLLAALTALVLSEIRALPRDTLIVRIDTARSAAAADTASTQGVQRIQEEIGNVGRRIAAAILILILVFYLLRGLLWLIETIADRSATRRLFFKRLIPIVRMLTWAIVLYFIVANVFDVDRNGLFAASAALGVGIGLAAQDVIKNILGGIIIIFDAPFQVGDKVRVGETYGEVKSIGLRSTRIVTLNDSLVSVPNSQLVDDQVSNSNAGVLDCQVVTKLYLPGWTNVALAKKIAYEAAANSRYIFLDKPIVVNIRDEFRETFLTEIIVKAYVLDHLYEAALASDITETAKMGFLDAGLLYPVYGLEPPEEMTNSSPEGEPS